MTIASLSNWLLHSDHVFARLVRFGVVGGSSGVVYAAVTALCVSVLHFSPVAASLIGYAFAVPMSFLGHRGFSFRSQGRWREEAPRFFVSQAVNITVAVLTMHGTIAMLHISYLWGMGATMVMIPIANFLTLHFWVFGRGHTATDPATAP